MKKIFSLINSYRFFIFKLFLYELFFVLLGYSGNSFIIRNNDNATDTIPCPYFFLSEIYAIIKLKKITSFIDLGCGNGRVLNFFNRNLKINYTGVELYLDSFIISRNTFKKYKNINIINKNFLKIDTKYLKYDCYFINDPLKKIIDHNNLVKKIFLAHKNSNKPFYFILINVSKSKLKIFNKLQLIKSRKISNRGYYIYSS